MIDAISSKWWLFLLRGLAAIIVAIVAFVQPGAALLALTLVLGAYALIGGILALTAAFTGAGGDRWWALFLEGVIGVVVATLIWSWPIASALGFVYFVAAWFIASGIFQVAAGVRLRDFIDNEWLLIVSGIISIAFGVLVFRSPIQGAVATAFLFGWYFLLFGIMQAALAFKLRSLRGGVPRAARTA